MSTAQPTVPTIWELANMVPLPRSVAGIIHHCSDDPVEARGPQSRTTLAGRIIRSLEQNGPATSIELAEELRLRKSQVSRLMCRLAARGLVQRGRWIVHNSRRMPLWERPESAGATHA